MDPGTRVSNLLVPYETSSPEGYWHRFWSGADRPSMRYELLSEMPTYGQWKWEKKRALRAVENYNKFCEEGGGRSLVKYWRDTGEKLEFIRKSSTGTVENWFAPSDDKIGDTVWDDVKIYENRKDYATQKHEQLLTRVIEWLSQPNDLVADFFCGSGTTLAVAEKLDRRWIGCDLGRWGIHITRKRLLSMEHCTPFDILNLGRLTCGTSLSVPSSLYLPGQTNSVFVTSIFGITGHLRFVSGIRFPRASSGIAACCCAACPGWSFRSGRPQERVSDIFR